MSRLELILKLEEDLAEDPIPSDDEDDEDIDDLYCEDCGELIDECECNED